MTDNQRLYRVAELQGQITAIKAAIIQYNGKLTFYRMAPAEAPNKEEIEKLTEHVKGLTQKLTDRITELHSLQFPYAVELEVEIYDANMQPKQERYREMLYLTTDCNIPKGKWYDIIIPNQQRLLEEISELYAHKYNSITILNVERLQKK